jgi:hypothetical protein
MNEREIIRIAVRASLSAIGAMVACIVALFLMAAAVSPEINIPGVHLSSITGRPSGD